MGRKWITIHHVQPNGVRQATIGRSQAILNQRGKRHPNQSKLGRRTQSQHGKRPKNMIMKLLKRRRSVIFIIHMIFDREESSKRNWRNESNLTCKNWQHSMNWELFLMNNKIWMAKV